MRSFEWTMAAALAAGAFAMPQPASGQDCGNDHYLLAANANAQDLGIRAYRVYEGKKIGGEMVDIIDLLDAKGAFIGQVMGGLLKEAEGLEGYMFTATDLVGEPPLLTLTGGDYMYLYSEQDYIGQLKGEGVTGPMAVTEDLGLEQAKRAIHFQAAVLSDMAIRKALGDSPTSQPFENPTEFGDGRTADAAKAADADCPWWVATTACGTCVACIWVGEAPPPCWGACITCGACLGIAIPKPKPSPTPVPPTPTPRPYPKPCVTFAGDTLVHTPNGLVEIQSLEVGDAIYSRNAEGEMIITAVSHREVHEDHIESVMYLGDDAIRSTRGHMMMGPDGWIPAEKLGFGEVLDITGKWSMVDSIDACEVGISDEVTSVCHILVEEGDGYFVGTSGLYAEAF